MNTQNENPNTPSRIKRCNDSSDEEDETIKARPERRKRLQKLAEKVRNVSTNFNLHDIIRFGCKINTDLNHARVVICIHFF